MLGLIKWPSGTKQSHRTLSYTSNNADFSAPTFIALGSHSLNNQKISRRLVREVWNLNFVAILRIATASLGAF